MHTYHLANSLKKGYIQIPHMNLSTIKVQTNVSKWMGNDWNPLLQVSSLTNYNMIHFTPLQKRGMSNSPYSIFNHLELCDDINYSQLEMNIKKMRESLGLKSMIDIVWNHIACNSPFLYEHPEIGYNLENSPHLKSAYDLDEALMRFSKQKERIIESLQDIDNLLLDFKEFLTKIALWEYWIINVEQTIENVLQLIDNKVPCSACNNLEDAILFDGLYNRYSYSMDITKLAYFYRGDIEEIRHFHSNSNSNPDNDKSIITCQFKDILKNDFDRINLSRYGLYDDKLAIIIENIKERIIYERLSDHGPRLGPISEKSPMLSTYFTRIERKKQKGTETNIDNFSDATSIDSISFDTDGNNDMNFISSSNHFHCFANNGWIWDADPLDNFAESTSEAYLFRKVIIWGDCVKLNYGKDSNHNPWLWKYMSDYTCQMASIFDAFRLDNCHSTPIHVARYLLEKARNSRFDLYVCAELFTGSPERDLLFVQELGIDTLIREAMVCRSTEELCNAINYYSDSELEISCKPHALLMDCTHDNETPTQKRTFMDTLPNAAIVAFCNSAIGSVRGYDDFNPSRLDIVNETRLYEIKEESTLMNAKRKLYELHDQMTEYNVTFAYSRPNDMAVITRMNPQTMDYFVLLARNAFFINENDDGMVESRDPLEITLNFDDSMKSCFSFDYRGNEIENANIDNLKISFDDFKLGQVVVLRKNERGNKRENRKDQVTPLSIPNTSLPPSLNPDISIFEGCNLVDMNYLIYKCNGEERDLGGGVYNVPGYGPLIYAGIQGAWNLLLNNNEAIFDNIRHGNWLLDYMESRIKRIQKGIKLLDWIKITFDYLRGLPRIIQPLKVKEALGNLHQVSIEYCWKLMNITNSNDEFLKLLSLGSVQLLGMTPSAGLLDSNISLAAGLPHFSTHHMRCWGRDTFISFHGLFLMMNRWKEAKDHIFSFAQSVKYGLIPNLLDGGRFPRYNSRDATWWFLSAYIDYCELCPDQEEGKDGKFEEKSGIFTLPDLSLTITNLIDSHLNGIDFVETANDPHIRSEGRRMKIWIDENTGFIKGGNRWNCGTWMDKMGSSCRAGNFGIPATPRDGAAIEIVALSYKCLDWYGKKMNRKDWINWSLKIKNSFDKEFYIPEKKYYKDSVDATIPGADLQLRPNYIVAMTLAPDLFIHAKEAIEMAEEYLDSPLGLGLKTLAHNDPNYYPNYCNDDSDDYYTSQGFNYHQGPEWLWLKGKYLLARRIFLHEKPNLSIYADALKRNPYCGLVELTNKDGSECRDSCATQAWSVATFIDLYYK